jgi:hypothetical protein
MDSEKKKNGAPVNKVHRNGLTEVPYMRSLSRNGLTHGPYMDFLQEIYGP